VIDLTGRVAIVTGAERGIGRAIALQFGYCGATVVINYYSDVQAAEQVATEITAAGGIASTTQADVSKTDQATALVKTAVNRYGKIDILVNNAGVSRWGLIVRLTEEDWDVVIDTNLKGTWNCCRAAVRHMIKQRYGRIVNITSAAGLIGQAANTNYSASKAGIIGLTKALAREVASRKITVNAVAPGIINAGLTSEIPPDDLGKLMMMIPFGEMGKAEDIAHAVTFLASDSASYITGHVLAVDGGMAMGQ